MKRPLILLPWATKDIKNTWGMHYVRVNPTWPGDWQETSHLDIVHCPSGLFAAGFVAAC
jgi:hypothetical protein